MNKEEILAMEAGRKLDNFVAHFVTNWIGDITLCPHYSEDISVAWPIAVKMGLGLFPLNNKDWACCKASHIYHVEIGQDHYADPTLVICQEAPEAICKAALLTKAGGDKGNRG